MKTKNKKTKNKKPRNKKMKKEEVKKNLGKGSYSVRIELRKTIARRRTRVDEGTMMERNRVA